MNVGIGAERRPIAEARGSLADGDWMQGTVREEHWRISESWRWRTVEEHLLQLMKHEWAKGSSAVMPNAGIPRRSLRCRREMQL